MEKTWYISVKIEGRASGAVKAESYDEAIQKAKDGDWSEEFEIDDWEFNTAEHRGGYIDAEEETP